MFFVEPLRDGRALSELAIKATPLVLIALGLAVGFRANVWNIGAEGQFIARRDRRHRRGDAGGPGRRPLDRRRRCCWPAWLGGMVWAAIVAWLRDRFNANEILVSLMLVYVAEQLLSYLVYGPWKDPEGYNFPQTITFADATPIPRLFERLSRELGQRASRCAGAAGSGCSCFAPTPASSSQVGGLAPRGGALRRLLSAARALDGAADLGRHGRARGRARGRRAARPADAARAGRLRLRRDHRRLRRAAAPGRHPVLVGADEHVLHRRRAGAVAPWACPSR